MKDKEMLMNQLTEVIGRLGWQLVVLKDEVSGDVLGAVLGEEEVVEVIMEGTHE